MALCGSYPWFAVRVRPRHEKVVECSIQCRVIELYLPLYRTRHKWADRYKELTLPLFPGYLFSRFDPYSKASVLSCPGVLEIVSIGHTPAPIDESEIVDLRKLTSTPGAVYGPWEYLKAGDPVEVVQGALRGIRGILIQIKSGVRIVISVSLLQRSIAIEIDRDCVAAIAPRKPPATAVYYSYRNCLEGN